MSMERRIASIIKWLERCLKACNSGALESALMDVECARADIENLRNEVWGKLERQHSAKERIQISWVSVNAVLGAVMAVLFVATPTAVFQDFHVIHESTAAQRQENFAAVPAAATLEWVTPDEKMLLGNLRRHLSENNSFASVPDTPERAETAESRTVRQPARQSEPEARPAADTENGGGISYERFFSLLQAGEKALKNDQPAIRVEM